MDEETPSAMDVVREALETLGVSRERGTAGFNFRVALTNELAAGSRFFRGITPERVSQAWTLFQIDPGSAFEEITRFEAMQAGQQAYLDRLQDLMGARSPEEEANRLARQGVIPQGDYPDFLGLAQTYRNISLYPGQEGLYRKMEFLLQVPPGTIQAPDGPTSIIGQEPVFGSLYTKWTPTSPMAHLVFSARKLEVEGSLAQAPQSARTPSIATKYTGEGELFRAPNALGRMIGFRDPRTGHWARSGIRLTPEQGNEIGRMIRGFLSDNYTRLIGEGHGGEQTGALRQAVASSDIDAHETGNNGYEIVVTLADLPGQARTESGRFRSPRPSTGTYGQWVFEGRRAVRSSGNQYLSGVPVLNRRGNERTIREGARGGRTAVYAARTFLRFMMHNVWITAENVRPSRKDLNVFELTQTQDRQVRERIAEMVSENIGRDSRNAIRSR